MSSRESIWTKKSTDEIELRWDATPFSMKTGILWRGEIILIEINDQFNSKGSTTTFKFTHNNQISIFGLGTWLGSGGGFGNSPKIKSSTHSLVIKTSLKFLRLADKPLEITNSATEFFEIPLR